MIATRVQFVSVSFMVAAAGTLLLLKLCADEVYCAEDAHLVGILALLIAVVHPLLQLLFSACGSRFYHEPINWFIPAAISAGVGLFAITLNPIAILITVSGTILFQGWVWRRYGGSTPSVYDALTILFSEWDGTFVVSEESIEGTTRILRGSIQSGVAQFRVASVVWFIPAEVRIVRLTRGSLFVGWILVEQGGGMRTFSPVTKHYLEALTIHAPESINGAIEIVHECLVRDVRRVEIALPGREQSNATLWWELPPTVTNVTLTWDFPEGWLLVDETDGTQFIEGVHPPHNILTKKLAPEAL